MALTRKVLRGLLESLKAEDGDVEATMDKILAEHGATIKDYKSRVEQFDELDVEGLKADKASLKGIKDKLGSLSLDDLIKEHSTLSETLKGRKLEDILSENAKYAENEAKAVKNSAIDALVKGYKFTSAAAERDIRSQIANMPMTKDGKGFVDAEKIMPGLLENNADAFMSGAKPPMFTQSGTTGGANSQTEQSAFLAKRYGLK